LVIDVCGVGEPILWVQPAVWRRGTDLKPPKRGRRAHRGVGRVGGDCSIVVVACIVGDEGFHARRRRTTPPAPMRSCCGEFKPVLACGPLSEWSGCWRSWGHRHQPPAAPPERASPRRTTPAPRPSPSARAAPRAAAPSHRCAPHPPREGRIHRLLLQACPCHWTRLPPSTRLGMPRMVTHTSSAHPRSLRLLAAFLLPLCLQTP
jgi:hypothetical protein